MFEKMFSSEAIIQREYIVDLHEWGDFEIESLFYDGIKYVNAKGTWEALGLTFKNAELDIVLNENIDSDYAEDFVNARWENFTIDQGYLSAKDDDIVEYYGGLEKVVKALNISL